MRICFLAPGNSVHTQRWVEYMMDKGHDVHLITLHKGDIPGAKIYYLPSRGKWTYLFFLSKIRFLIRTICPDVLHAHYASSYGFLGACSGFHPFVVSVWGWDVVNFPENSFLHKLLIKYTLQKADKITATSRMLTSTTINLASVAEKISVIPFGVDIVLFHPRTKPLEEKTVNIGVVKTLHAKYGIEYLIRAFALVEKKFKDVNLMIVGGGPLRKNLQRLANKLGCAKKIDFIGEISHSQVPEYLKKTDIFVVPSIDKSESFGVAAVEASACGIPVIASNIGGLPEVVLHKKTGFLTPPKDHYLLAEAIVKLIENPDLRKKFGEEGRKFVSEHYDWRENCQRMHNLYQTLL